MTTSACARVTSKSGWADSNRRNSRWKRDGMQLKLLLVLANQGIARKFDYTLWFQDMPFNTLFTTSKCMVKAGV